MACSLGDCETPNAVLVILLFIYRTSCFSSIFLTKNIPPAGDDGSLMQYVFVRELSGPVKTICRDLRAAKAHNGVAVTTAGGTDSAVPAHSADGAASIYCGKQSRSYYAASSRAPTDLQQERLLVEVAPLRRRPSAAAARCASSTSDAGPHEGRSACKSDGRAGWDK